MLPLKGYFEGLFERIKPPKERRELAKTLPSTVREHLVRSESLVTATNAPQTRLAGSYGRKTGQGDIHDVDLLVFVDESYLNHSPELVLDDLAEALRELEVDGYGKGEVKTNRKNRRSHHVEFKKDGKPAFHIDCVPVVRPGDDPDAVLEIPDREWSSWDRTQPLGYATKLTTLNQNQDEKVLPTVRMFKRIREKHLRASLKRPKSFWLEAKIYALWRDGRLSKSKNWADLMCDLVRALRTDCGSTPMSIPDPSLGRNLTSTWEQPEFDEFVAMLDEVIGYLEEVGDRSGADDEVAVWQKIFGADVFQLLDDEAAKIESASKVASSGAIVTRTGAIAPIGSGLVGVAIRQHRFHGDC